MLAAAAILRQKWQQANYLHLLFRLREMLKRAGLEETTSGKTWKKRRSVFTVSKSKVIISLLQLSRRK